ncbi:MAG: SDR family NAD(P)-dependent oxidoreductase [Myxococcales bacterium]|nr:MAG: SDR family NAD(P)-dependent oxidoreductase [Myxococcales bacterium]
MSGKAVVVTGASSGIGEALAERLGEAGAKVLLVARSADKLDEMKRAIEASGGVAFAYAADLSSAEDTRRAVEAILADHGQVDILVNNAGISIRGSVAKSYDRLHDFERTLALNFLGAVRLIMGFLPGMRAQKQGQIINVSTVGVQVNAPRYGAYIASKAALDAFSRVLAVEVLKDGVKVTTFYMPLVKTPMMESTTIYQSFPMRNANQAADLIVEGIVHQPKRVAIPVGNLFEFAYGVAPKAIDRVLNAAYQLYPESGDKKDQRDPVSRDAAMFQRVFKAVTRRARRRGPGRQ